MCESNSVCERRKKWEGSEPSALPAGIPALHQTEGEKGGRAQCAGEGARMDQWAMGVKLSSCLKGCLPWGRVCADGGGLSRQGGARTPLVRHTKAGRRALW